MTEINTLPRGLSALMQLKSQNDVPKNLFDEIIGNINLFPMYFEGLSPETINSTLGSFDSATSKGVNTIDAQLFGFEISDTALTIVQMASARVFGLNAGVRLIAMGAFVSFPVGGGTQGICQVTQMGPTVLTGSVVYDGVKDLFVPPGGSFGFHIQTETAISLSTYSIAFGARYAKLHV